VKNELPAGDVPARSKDLLDVVLVLRILAVKDLVATAHIGSRQLILGALVLLQLEMSLPEA